MKLATLKKTGARDGVLVVVSSDLRRMSAVVACGTLQHALDRWELHAPLLQEAAMALDANSEAGEPFDPRNCHAPLPRAYQWLDASAYLNHVELVRKARGAQMPPEFLRDPLIYQGGSDDFLGPCDPIHAESEQFGVDLEAEVVVVTADVPLGCSADDAAERIRLVGLANDITLRNLVQPEIGKGFGFLQSKPATAFSPVFVTPDELGGHWSGSKLRLPLRSQVNESEIGHPDAGVDMNFDFAQLIAHAARTRNLSAGTIIGSGTVSNRDAEAGVSCLAEKRVREQIQGLDTLTPFLRDGDTVRIEMRLGNASIFGAIEQTVRIGARRT